MGRVKLSRHIIAHARAAVKLVPDEFTVHYVIGSWEFAIASITWMERQLAQLFIGGIPEGSFEAAQHSLLSRRVLYEAQRACEGQRGVGGVCARGQRSHGPE